MGSRAIDILGNRYSRWVVLGRAEMSERGEACWLCKCDCGTERVVTGGNLRSGRSQSCGCARHTSISLPKGEAALNRLITNYKRSAAHRGYEWELTDEQVRTLTQQPCYYCGVEPSQKAGGNRCNGDYIYNGIDRQDNSVGYTLDNVVPSCKQCNFAKRDVAPDEFMDWIQRVYQHSVIQNR